MMKVITVNNLSKRFMIPHEKRDTLFERIVGLFRGNKRYEEFWALNDISFDVGRGETFGIIGLNGSGKTTLLSIMANVLKADGGEYRVDGKITPFLGLGVGFEPELTAKENVFLYASILGLSKKEITEKYPDIVRFAQLERFMDMKLKNLSSGMYMRLAFSIAINVDPDVLLIDEILTVGDEGFQKKSIEKILEFKKKGKTIVLVSHDLEMIRSLCNRCILLIDGRIHASGTPENVIKDYRMYMTQKEKSTRENRMPGRDRNVRITGIKLLDLNNSPQDIFSTGDSMKVRVYYETLRPFNKPNLGINIYDWSGAYYSGINTLLDDIKPESLTGKGFFELTYDQVGLLPGNYEVMGLIAEDYRVLDTSDIRTFKIQSERKYQGVLYIKHKWQIRDEGFEYP